MLLPRQTPLTAMEINQSQPNVSTLLHVQDLTNLNRKTEKLRSALSTLNRLMRYCTPNCRRLCNISQRNLWPLLMSCLCPLHTGPEKAMPTCKLGSHGAHSSYAPRYTSARYQLQDSPCPCSNHYLQSKQSEHREYMVLSAATLN